MKVNNVRYLKECSNLNLCVNGRLPFLSFPLIYRLPIQSSDEFHTFLTNFELLLVTTMMDIMFSEFLILYQFIFSPQMKRRMVISNKVGIYELPHELPNNLRLRILGNEETSAKSQNIIKL